MTQISCPKCGNQMRLRNGKYGEFYGCSTYPKCRGTRNISDARDQQVLAKVQTQQVVKEFKPSRFQAKVYEFISQDSGNAVVEAVAGSGKTRETVGAGRPDPIRHKPATRCHGRGQGE